MGDSIKCLAIINLTSNQTLFLSSLNRSSIEYFPSEIDQILRTLRSLSSNQKELSRIHSSTGIWYCKLIPFKEIMLITLVSTRYPSKSAIRLLCDFEKEARNIPDFERKELNRLLGKEADYLMQNYEKDPDFNDQFKSLEQSIESISAKMGDNIRNITANKEGLEGIEKKSGEMDQMATKFRNDSNALKRQMFWHQYKVWIILGVIFIVCLTVIIVIATQEDD